MNFSPELVLVLTANAVMIGSAWGSLKAGQNRNGKDIVSIKKSLGLENGQQGGFVRREEWDIQRDSQDTINDRLERELVELRKRVT